MKSEWTKVPLSHVAEVQTGPFGSQLHNKDYVAKGTPIVTVEHLGSRAFTTQNLPCVSKEDKCRLSKYSLRTGDIVFSRVGSVDRCSYVDETSSGWLFSGRCLRVRSTNIHPEFLYYFFCQEPVKEYIKSIAVGATMPSINTKLLNDVEVILPPLPVQRKIASILSALDDKIETNNAICRNLEEQVRLIFKKSYKEGNNFHLGVVGDVVTLQRGYDLPKTKIKEGEYPVAGSTDVIAYHNEYNSEAPCIILGRSGNVGKPRLYLERVWAHNTSLFSKTFHKSDPIWVYYSLLDIDFSTLMGGSAVPTLNRNHVHIQPLSIAPLQKQREFSNKVRPMLLMITTVKKENKKLSQLRTALLQKLMSGEIDLSTII